MRMNYKIKHVPSFYQNYPPYCSNLVLEENLPLFVAFPRVSFWLNHPSDLRTNEKGNFN